MLTFTVLGDFEVSLYPHAWIEKLVKAPLKGIRANLERITVADVERAFPADFKSDCLMDGNTFAMFEMVGNLQVMQWLHGKGMELTPYNGCMAAMCGHVHILEWLNKRIKKRCMPYKFAAYGGQVHVLQWLLDNGYPVKDFGIPCLKIGAWAAWGGHKQVLTWMEDNDLPFDLDQVGAFAAKGGHLELLKSLVGEQISYQAGWRICYNATLYNRYHIVRWACEKWGKLYDNAIIKAERMPSYARNNSFDFG